MRVFLLLLRLGIFVIVLGGVAASGWFGFMWSYYLPDDKRLTEQKVKDLDRTGGRAKLYSEDKVKLQEEFEVRAKAAPFLLAGAVLGLVGGLLIVGRRHKSGMALLLLSTSGPIVFAWPFIWELIEGTNPETDLSTVLGADLSTPVRILVCVCPFVVAVLGTLVVASMSSASGAYSPPEPEAV